MKMSVLSLTSAVLLVGAGAFTTSAQAQQSFVYPQGYLGADAMFWSLDPERGTSRDNVGLRLRGGSQFNDYFGVEGHLGTGGSDGPAELDYLAGIYAKGIIPIAPEVRLYGLAGFTEVDFNLDRESDFSYGGGAEMDLTRNLSLGADYMRYLDKSAYTFDAASVGLRYRF